jgi:hypothetical protein
VFFLVVFCLLSQDDVPVFHGCFASYLGIVFMFFLVVLPPYLGIISMFLLVVLQWFCLLPRITVILFGCFASCLGVFGSFAFCLEFFSGQGAAGVATTGAAVSFLVSFHMAIPMNRNKKKILHFFTHHFFPHKNISQAISRHSGIGRKQL